MHEQSSSCATRLRDGRARVVARSGLSTPRLFNFVPRPRAADPPYRALLLTPSFPRLPGDLVQGLSLRRVTPHPVRPIDDRQPPSRCSQIVTRQPASVPRKRVRSNCYTRSPSRQDALPQNRPQRKDHVSIHPDISRANDTPPCTAAGLRSETAGATSHVLLMAIAWSALAIPTCPLQPQAFRFFSSLVAPG
jgi:hypothetical protein